MKKSRTRLDAWAEAQKRFHLSDLHIQMARELGLNPKKFGGLANHRQEPWKLPLPEFIAECYRKRFHRRRWSPSPRSRSGSSNRLATRPNTHENAPTHDWTVRDGWRHLGAFVQDDCRENRHCDEAQYING